MKIPKSTKSIQYPEFIRQHKVVQKNSKQEKIFPKIGLKNSSKKLALSSISDFDKDILEYLSDVNTLLANEIENQSYDNYYNNSTSTRQSQIEFVAAIKKITASLKSQPASFINKTDAGVDLILPFDMSALGSDFTAGTSLLSVLKKIKTNSRLGNLSRMDSLFDKHNSFLNLQKDNLKIVFSGAGDKGLWDLATMSMRGITSCQKWGNHHARALVGSMVDPYAGIIYITSNAKMKYGANMIRRAVVRFVVNENTRKPAILIERIYPHDYNSGLSDTITLMAFKDFIKKKTKNKFPVVYGEFSESRRHFIPITKSVSELGENSGERSYRDSKIPYRSSPKYKDVSKFSL